MKFFFNKPPAGAPKQKSTVGGAAPHSNPYLNARREWDERYGDLLSRAHNWQRFALISAAVSAVAVAGIAWIGSQSKIQPFVVVADQLGNPVAVARPQALARSVNLDERVIRSQLATFIVNARTIIGDMQAQQVLFDKTFAMIGQPVVQMMTSFLRDERTPMQIKGTTVQVQVQSVMPVSSDTWQVDWTETVYSQAGASAATEKWRALITVGYSGAIANDTAKSIWNPFGVVVRQLSWQKLSV